jgi:hypothetical protein
MEAKDMLLKKKAAKANEKKLMKKSLPPKAKPEQKMPPHLCKK